MVGICHSRAGGNPVFLDVVVFGLWAENHSGGAVAAAVLAEALGVAGGEFGDVFGGDGVEVEVEVGGDDGRVPEAVADFFGQFGGGDGVTVADEFFDFVTEFADFAGPGDCPEEELALVPA